MCFGVASLVSAPLGGYLTARGVTLSFLAGAGVTAVAALHTMLRYRETLRHAAHTARPKQPGRAEACIGGIPPSNESPALPALDARPSAQPVCHARVVPLPLVRGWAPPAVAPAGRGQSSAWARERRQSAGLLQALPALCRALRRHRCRRASAARRLGAFHPSPPAAPTHTGSWVPLSACVR